MKVSFELSPRDVRHFRERLKAVRQGQTAQDVEVVAKLARQMVREALDTRPPEFVEVRIEKLSLLIDILLDDEWRLLGRDRVRILDAVAYFVDPDDLINDRVPGLGYLDDAIMIELIAEELKHDIRAYVDFCAFREKLPSAQAEEKLARRRKTLHERLRKRRREDRQATRNSPSSRSPFRLW